MCVELSILIFYGGWFWKGQKLFCKEFIIWCKSREIDSLFRASFLDKLSHDVCYKISGFVRRKKLRRFWVSKLWMNLMIRLLNIWLWCKIRLLNIWLWCKIRLLNIWSWCKIRLLIIWLWCKIRPLIIWLWCNIRPLITCLG